MEIAVKPVSLVRYESNHKRVTGLCGRLRQQGETDRKLDVKSILFPDYQIVTFWCNKRTQEHALQGYKYIFYFMKSFLKKLIANYEWLVEISNWREKTVERFESSRYARLQFFVLITNFIQLLQALLSAIRLQFNSDKRVYKV